MAAENKTNDTITVPGAPDIAGMRFRGFRGEADYAHIVAVFNQAMQADGVERIKTLEEAAKDYAPASGFDPYRDLLFAEADGQVIGYSFTIRFEEESGGLYYHSTGFLLPEWRRKGIGRAMLRRNEAHLRQVAAGYDDDQPCFLESIVVESDAGAAVLLLSEGYQPVVYFADMVRPDLENIPGAPLPEGLEVRPVKPEHYRAIWEAHEDAMRDHWGSLKSDEENYRRWLDDPITFQPELWKIAWDGDQVAGQVKSFINHEENEVYNRRRGYTEFISVCRPWRRRGLARALLVQSLHEIKARGMEQAALSVHTENRNGAFRLYESVGFRHESMTVVYQKPLDAGR